MKDLAKKVVDMTTGKVLGYVLDIAMDYDKLEQIGFFVVDEETEGEYLLRFEDIEKAEDVLLVRDITALEFAVSREKNLIGKEVLSEKGISFGVVDRLVFDKKKLSIVCTNRCEIPARMISYVGEDCLFLKGRSKKSRKKNPFKNLVSEEKVVALSSEKEKVAPEKINLSYSFFAGKVAACDVFGYNNERIVLKNEKITKLIFENAKKHNKLNELFFAAKKY